VLGETDGADQFAGQVTAANHDGVGIRGADCGAAVLLAADFHFGPRYDIFGYRNICRYSK
jgi:hypothetical protein